MADGKVSNPTKHVALNDLKTFTSMHQRFLAPYAELKAGLLLVVTPIVLVVWRHSLTAYLFANPLVLVLSALLWFVTIRALARGGSCEYKADLSEQTVVVTGAASGIGF